MSKVIAFIKKWWIIIGLSLLASLLLWVVIGNKEGQANPPLPSAPTPTPTSILNPLEKPLIWEGVTPGETKRSDLSKILGFPLAEKTKDGYQILEFQSKSKTRRNEIYLKNDVVQQIRAKITAQDNKDFPVLSQKYGQPEKIYYDENASVGFQIGAYFSKGLAIDYHPGDGTVLEIWYFIPTSENGFNQEFKLSTQPREEFNL